MLPTFDGRLTQLKKFIYAGREYVFSMNAITVKCKKCGRPAKSDEFTLDLDFKMMVCAQCIKEKLMKKEVYSELAKEKVVARPAGWDNDDDLLEKRYNLRLKDSVKVERIDNSKVKYTCPKCGYRFSYDTDRNYPSMCTYCGEGIKKIRYD